MRDMEKRVQSLLAESATLRAELRRNIGNLQRTMNRMQALQFESRQAPKARSGGFDCLTQREEEVLRLIVDGKSTKEVAAKLGISFKTAVCHRTRIMEKLDIHETATLVRYAIRHGLITA